MLPVLIEIHDPAEGISTEIAFAESPIRIGRNPLNNIHLDHSFVSQWHALIEFDAVSTRYHDLGSTNGTLHENRRLGRDPIGMPSSGVLELQVGALTFRITRAPADTLLLAAGRAPYTTTSKRAAALSAALGLDARPEETTRSDTVMLVPDPPAVLAAIQRIAPVHEQARQAWRGLLAALRTELAPLAPDQRATLINRFAVAMPALMQEPEFQQLARDHGATLPVRPSSAETALRALQKFVELYTPGVRQPSTPADIQRLVMTIVRVIELSTKSYVELRNGQEEFGSEMAVRTIKQASRLSAARTTDDVIAYLLDWTADSDNRLKELITTYADIMIHQVALINGLMEGVRGLLRRLGPASIAREVDARPFRLGPLRLPRFLVPRAVLRWHRFAELHRNLTEEDSSLTAALFGREFARAYEAIGGEPQVSAPAATAMLRQGDMDLLKSKR